MQPDQPLLTIAIPTYNREQYLNELLSVLLPQISDFKRVEVVISDNDSSDGTSTMLAAWRANYPALKCYFNHSNVGPDRNILNCFDYAEGKYVWILGDDDIVLPGGIDLLIGLLSRDDYGLVFMVPYEFRKNWRSEQREDRLGRVAEVITDQVTYISRLNAMIAFISSNIVNKNYYSSIKRLSLTEFLDTNLLQLGWMFPVLACNHRFLIVWKRIVAGRGGNTSGWGVCNTFGTNLDALLQLVFDERQDLQSAMHRAILREWFPTRIIEMRTGKAGPVHQEEIELILKPVFCRYWRYWIILYPLITLPLGLAKVWYRVYATVVRGQGILGTSLGSIFHSKDYLK
jgi:abequosyltransferase